VTKFQGGEQPENAGGDPGALCAEGGQGLEVIGQRWKEAGFDPFADTSTPELRKESRKAHKRREQRNDFVRGRNQILPLLTPPGSVADGVLTLELALDRLERVHRRGREWTAFCPAHDTHHRSLVVSESKYKPGTPVFHCYAGCSHEAVKAAVIAMGTSTPS
jgi:hypothetical protein